MPNAAAQNGAGPGAPLEPLAPSMFSRVQEPDSDGQVYDIEILTQPIGCHKPSLSPSPLIWLQEYPMMTTLIDLLLARYELEHPWTRIGREW